MARSRESGGNRRRCNPEPDVGRDITRRVARQQSEHRAVRVARGKGLIDAKIHPTVDAVPFKRGGVASLLGDEAAFSKAKVTTEYDPNPLAKEPVRLASGSIGSDAR